MVIDTAPPDGDPPIEAPLDVLELRIHGVSNTSPADMLSVTADRVVQVDGDTLGSFWRDAPRTGPPPPRWDPAWVPAGVSREAYSWGGLSRTTLPDSPLPGVPGAVAAAAGRLGWTFLLPFGLTNVAYWTRRLPEPPDDAGPAAEPVDEERPRTGGPGAGLTRLFGLLLTLLMVVTASEVALDLVGTQCFAGGTSRCGSLPSLFGGLASWGWGQRLALLSLVPVALLVGLWWLGQVSSQRYEGVTIGGPGTGRTAAAALTPPPGSAGGGGRGAGRAAPPLLGHPGFWANRQATDRDARLHLAAGLAAAALGTAWPAMLSGAECSTPVGLLGRACAERVTRSPRWWVFAVVGLAAVAVLLLAAVHLVRERRVAPVPPGVGARPDPAGHLLRAGAAVFVVELVALLAAGPSAAGTGLGAGALAGLTAAPTLLVAGLAAIAVSGLSWRAVDVTGRRTRGSSAARSAVAAVLGFAVPLTALLPALGLGGGAVVWTVAVAGVAALVSLARRLGLRRTDDRDGTSWSGAAPGVFLLLALAVSTTLSSLVVLTVGNWLNGARGTGSLLTPGPAGRPEGPDAPALTVPAVYVWSGVAALVSVLVLVLTVLVLLGRLRQGPPAAVLTPPMPVDPGATSVQGVAQRHAGSVAGLLRLQRLATLPPADLRAAAPTPAERMLLALAAVTRRRAGLLQRAELLVLALTALASAAVVVALVLTTTSARPPAAGQGGAWDALWRDVVDWGAAGVAATGLAIVLAVAGARRRPLGLVWDLTCFLPRAGHPLGPPCYAERAVPEVVRRVEWFLERPEALVDPPPAGPAPTGPASERAVPARAVLLSAHSLGAVLAVAAVCTLADRHRERSAAGPWIGAAGSLPRVALLTYGAQLRPYFSRLFPELLGPGVLGTAVCPAPALTGADPWHGNPRPAPAPLPAPAPAPAPAFTVASVLGSRWRTLWRRTDPLGFRVVVLGAPGHDVAAEEFDTSGYVVVVGTHGDYPRTLAHLAVRAALLAELEAQVRPRAGRA